MAKGVDGTWSHIGVPKPTVVDAYNQTMGGTDKFDQLGSYYDSRHRLQGSWQPRIYSHFLRAAVINAMILFNSGNGNKVSLLQFTNSVILDWSGIDEIQVACEERDEDDDDDELEEVCPTRSAHRSTWSKAKDLRLQGVHAPSSTELADRKKCKMCSARTVTFCKTCKAHLCIERPGRQDFWGNFHTFEEL